MGSAARDAKQYAGSSNYAMDYAKQVLGAQPTPPPTPPPPPISSEPSLLDLLRSLVGGK